MNKILRFAPLASLCLSLVACFESADTGLREQQPASEAVQSEITPKDFQGADAANNTVTGIEIRWTPALKPVSSYKIYRVNGKKLSLLTSVTGDLTSYIDGSVIWGSIYSYVVRAADSKGIEDSNSKQVSALSWAGMSSVEAESRTALRVRFDYATPIADEVRLYIQPAIGQGAKELAATITGSDLEAVIEDLRPGFKYHVTAQAYISSLKKEDGNKVAFTISTKTEGFHAEDGSQPKWNNVVNVRAFGDSPGSPEHPNIPGKSPKNRIVELAFLSFSSMPTNTKYVVVRAKEGLPLNTSTPDNCTETMETSCKVACDLSGAGVLVCKDERIAEAPMRYRYTMAIVHTDGDLSWAESVPEDQLENFSVLVPIPPKNMVLVQRDAANYEMCMNTMNKTPDPTNHNRCTYNGIGATPYNSGPDKAPLGLPSGYYDFGYNLFVDRYPLACNWTRASEGGKCGPNQTSGDCVKIDTVSFNPNTAAGAPFGEDGQVMYVMMTNSNRTRCYIKDNGTWRHFAHVPVYINNTDAAYQKMVTSDPAAQGGQRPNLNSMNSTPESTNQACNSQVDSSYGPKRIPRMREYRAFNAFPTIPDEPYYIPYSKATTILFGGNHNASDGYRCGGTINEALPAGTDHDSMLAAWLGGGNEITAVMNSSTSTVYGLREYFIGAVSNIDCQTRYGAQVFNGNYMMSDYLTYNTATKKMTGGLSPIDNGNRDLLGDINGGSNGFVLDMNKISPNVNNDYVTYLSTIDVNNNKNYTAVTLGLPIYLSSSQEYLSNTIFTLQKFSDSLTFTNANENSATPLAKQVLVSSRWSSYIRKNWTEANDYTATMVRCVLPAE